MPEVSVIIVTTEPQVTNIESLQWLYENATVDFEPIIRTDKGISRARNRGVDEASTDKLVFLDDDATPEPGYLRAMADALDEHAVVTGPVIQPDGLSEQLSWERDRSDIIGCNMGFRREIFESVGYFDEQIMYGHDETEFQARFQSEYAVHWAEDAAVHHAYTTGVSDHLRKMWQMGKADVYYGQTVGTRGENSDGDGILRTLLHPSQFIAETPQGTAVKATGRVIRNMAIALTVVGFLQAGSG